MKIGYKIRSSASKRNDWIIAVIYDLDGWPGRSLKHQGLSDPQFTREATEVEELDHEKSQSTRCYCAKYSNLEGFVEDENLCNVSKELIDKVCEFYNNLKNQNDTSSGNK